MSTNEKSQERGPIAAIPNPNTAGAACPSNLPRNLWEKMLSEECHDIPTIERYRPLLSIIANYFYRKNLKNEITKIASVKSPVELSPYTVYGK
jgi:hypothetical protein